ncbi:MAG: (2Fe-2S)-binding protein [Anaerolineales bacterium]|nr:(2Fe-2S)-binding protein [Anaerolineales bacterium]
MHPIEESLAKLGQLHQEGRGRLLAQPDDQPGWISVRQLADAQGPALAEVIERTRKNYPTEQLRPPAMLWFGHYIYPIQLVSMAMFLVEQRVPDLRADSLQVRFDEHGGIAGLAWTGRGFVALPGDPAADHADCEVVADRDALREALRARLIESFTPVVDATFAYSRLGKSAMWSTAADYCAYALMWLGELMGNELIGAQESRAFAAVPSLLSLRNDLIAVEHLGETHYMVNRNSCCLYYRTDNSGMCSSCPHRPLEERVEMVRKHIEEEHANA